MITIHENSTHDERMQAATEYREQAKYHAGVADGLSRQLELFNDEMPAQLERWTRGERDHHRAETIKCYELAIKVLKAE